MDETPAWGAPPDLETGGGAPVPVIGQRDTRRRRGLVRFGPNHLPTVQPLVGVGVRGFPTAVALGGDSRTLLMWGKRLWSVELRAWNSDTRQELWRRRESGLAALCSGPW